jgi:hypothetical protein
VSDPLRDRLIAAVGDAYDVGPEVGRGGVAVVYRASDKRLRRDVAIKVLPPELAFRVDVRTRFQREAETAAQLAHPNIVPIYSVHEEGGLVYFVMQLVVGESLAARLARESTLGFADVRRILSEVGDALDFAHARGVVHRDIKPDNILLDAESGRALVTDYGIARAAEADVRLTATGVAMGTPTYMSPEQALGERELDGRSDIYSLGAVGYQMLVGVPPFRAGNTPAMLMKHINETPEPLRSLRRDVPGDLERLVERALAKRPEDRWQRAAQFRAEIEGRAIPHGPAYRIVSDDAEPAWVPNRAGEHAAAPRRSTPPPAARVPAPLRRPQELAPAHGSGSAHAAKKREKQNSIETFAAKPMEHKLRLFRAQAAGSAGTVGALAAVNVMTSPEFLWFIFPAVFMTIGVLQRGAVLWGDGVRFRDMFRGRPPEVEPQRSVSNVDAAAAKLAPGDVLEGAQGSAVRRAVGDQQAIEDIVRGLSPEDRALIPEVLPTVNSLVTRAVGLAQLLHHLERALDPAPLAKLDERLRAVEGEPQGSADRERRLTLLRRQRATLEDLHTRRERVTAKLESALIALASLRLDLLKLRSSGMQAGLQEVNHATVEARALSRDIGHALAAVEEVRDL